MDESGCADNGNKNVEKRRGGVAEQRKRSITSNGGAIIRIRMKRGEA